MMSTAPSEVELSVVVPFRNAGPHIREQFEALAEQDVAGPWEVIAVDNGSSDESRRIVEGFHDRLNLHIVDAAERPGAARAKNAGARHASGRKLIFIDADDEVTPGFLHAMGAALGEHDFVISSFDHETLNPEWVRSAQEEFVRDPEDPLAVHFGVLPAAGGSVGVTRRVFDAVGGYPEDFPRMEDIAMSWEIQLGGTSLHHVPEAMYRVRHRQSIPALFRQSLAGGSSGALLYKRYRTAGMHRRTLPEVLRSWARIMTRVFKARNKEDLATVVVQLGRELGRLKGSLRYKVNFP
jgi:glycosyltransferase involved in cell wall biosynthesis